MHRKDKILIANKKNEKMSNLANNQGSKKTVI